VSEPRMPSTDEKRMLQDLSEKASLDATKAVRTTLELASMMVGPNGVSTVQMHVAGTQTVRFATCLSVVRDSERGIAVDKEKRVSNDDVLLAALMLASGYFNPDAVSETASMMFRVLTGRDPDLPASWRKTVNAQERP